MLYLYLYTMALGIIVTVVIICPLVNYVIKKSRSMRLSPEYRAKVFKKIGKLYDKVGMNLWNWDVFAVEIIGATLDNDANVKHIKGGRVCHFTVKARTIELAKATFLVNHYNWFIVDCKKIKEVMKLEYA